MSDSGAAGEYRMKLLVQGELDAISYLQGFLGFRGGSDGAAADPADVSRHYAPGADWGPMAKYGACPIVRDKCMVHATDRECVLDELCGWCASRLLCVDRLTRTRPELVTGDPVPVCPHPLLVLAASADAQAGRLDAAATGGLSVLTTQGALGGSPGSAADCGLVVTRNRPLQVHLVGNAKMLFHFATENAGTLHSSFDAAGAVDDLGAHVWIPADSTPEFLEFMHGYSDACYRWTYEVPAGGEAGTVCYTNNKIGRDGGPVRVALWDAGTRAPAPDPAWDSDPALAAYKPTGGASDGDSPGVTPEADAIAAGMRLGLAGIARWLRAEDKAAEAAAVEVDGRKSMFDFLIHVMGLWDVAPSLPHVTLLSRRNKRLILNEPELLAAVVEGLGGAAPADSVAVELASLETMTLYEQLALFRRTTVLAGIHGSGLINSIFMHPGTALVQLMPFNVQSGASFFAGPAASTGVAYFEWCVQRVGRGCTLCEAGNGVMGEAHQYTILLRVALLCFITPPTRRRTNPKRENTVYHWHFLGRDHAGDREQLVTCGSSCGGPDVYFSFHINQVRRGQRAVTVLGGRAAKWHDRPLPITCTPATHSHSHTFFHAHHVAAAAAPRTALSPCAGHVGGRGRLAHHPATGVRGQRRQQAAVPAARRRRVRRRVYTCLSDTLHACSYLFAASFSVVSSHRPKDTARPQARS